MGVVNLQLFNSWICLLPILFNVFCFVVALWGRDALGASYVASLLYVGVDLHWDAK